MWKPRGSPDHRSEADIPPQRRVTVILDQGVNRMADILQDALGSGYHLVAFPPANDVIAVLSTTSPEIVAAHRQLHPGIGLVVTGVGDQPDAVAAVLEAGADDCLRATNHRELAARLIALSRRRLMTSKGDPPLRLSFEVIDPGA
jgi:hypothetical protein